MPRTKAHLLNSVSQPPPLERPLDDPELLRLLDDEFHIDLTQRGLRWLRSNGKAPPYHRSGKAIRTMPRDARVWAAQRLGRAFRSPADEQAARHLVDTIP